MGLKWFRARLSMKKEVTKIPEMTGLYRRISYFESAIQKNAKVLVTPFSIITDSTASDDNETVQCDYSKTDLTSQLSSSNEENMVKDNKENMTKDNDKKSQINNHAVENMELSISIKDPNIKQQSTCGEESNNMTKDPICSDNELVI